jgi:hypothetical protein
MKLKITTNFSFEKLANQIPDLYKQYFSAYAKGAEAGTKENIDQSKNVQGKALTSFTARIQKRKPLIKTGKMRKSLKSDNNTLSILEYGYKHNEGLWANLRPITNVKDFIGITKPLEEVINKKFIDNINKALKK